MCLCVRDNVEFFTLSKRKILCPLSCFQESASHYLDKSAMRRITAVLERIRQQQQSLTNLVSFFKTLLYMIKLTNLCLQMEYWSPEVIIIRGEQQSYMCPPPVNPAHYPSLISDTSTVWRAQDSCAAEDTTKPTPVTPALSGAQTLGHGRRRSSICIQGDGIMSPGLRTMVWAPILWAVLIGGQQQH